MAEMELERERRHEEKGQSCEQREAVGGFNRFDAEDAFERGEDKGAGHQSGDEWVENDEHAPVERDFVRIHETFHAGHSLSPCN